ncbi:hypothetical protein [Halosegnis sp.]|uniref:DUF7524 family protein n=1 Tax=Halosegnis sp. TaxID=2864959 RepID=UPI0035D4EB1A
MTDTLVAEINRAGLHSLEVPEQFETDGSFVVELRNRGEPTHVHLHLDDPLSTVGHIEANNHYVAGGDSRRVRVELDAPPGTSRQGSLKLVTAHGAQTRYVTIVVDATDEGVTVDPELGTPSDPDSPAPLADVDPLHAASLGIGGVGVLLAVAAVLAANGLTVAFGVLAVLAGLIAVGLATMR